ncbi:Ribosomal large subunit pseudouridine synthase D [Candidatus Portiera aleyrodidarum]|uniref:Pseudouridine synthase n=1 Tax=Candidatus Portiera aleyrodidarum TV TaxID=1297582 RepID=A0A8D4BPI9_9GAMM|nr:RluA family pseudouridine synthase [Candidatus Portiera aleyrodidarum]AGI27095.1 23S RNA-specific pseudouridylate synthase [Candidatus Portiera aleyrodidarum TV]CEI59061.1 Ribosomal large subunit pseudouridine synthase D [Candidatus Portiera aleyrodidarum]
MITIKYISSNMQGMRLDKASRELFNITREKIKKFINHRKLIVDGYPAKPKTKINEGQCIVLLSINKDYFVEKVLKPEDIKIDIIYEDKDLMIINKKHGLVVHPSKGNIKGTLVNALLYHKNNTELIKMPRAGLVHRIDKETSGLLLIAKTLVTYKQLIKQIKDKSIIREYDALVIGKLFIGGCIKAQIGRHFKNRKRKIVRSDGKLAITHYRVIERFKLHTYIRCWLETGRTHQIRVHMEYINISLIGDSIYLNKKILPKFKRQALHAHCLIFQHPTKKEKVKIKIKVPKDMKILLNILRNNKIYTMSKKYI